MTEYQSVTAITLGRHTDAVESSSCTRAIKKEILVSEDGDDVSLYVRVECDDCGVIETGRADMTEITEDEDDE